MVARWFRISFAENALRRFAAESSVSLETLRAPDAVALVLGFYRERRAQHARITDEGDGLLWQWGPDADAERFYRHFDFIPFQRTPRRLFLAMSQVAKLFS